MWTDMSQKRLEVLVTALLLSLKQLGKCTHMLQFGNELYHNMRHVQLKLINISAVAMQMAQQTLLSGQYNWLGEKLVWTMLQHSLNTAFQVVWLLKLLHWVHNFLMLLASWYLMWFCSCTVELHLTRLIGMVSHPDV
jgi:hypothetical protein